LKKLEIPDLICHEIWVGFLHKNLMEVNEMVKERILNLGLWLAMGFYFIGVLSG